MARNVVKKMRQKNKERAMIERKCFCRGFGHIACYCRNVESRQKEEPTQRSLNKFEVLKSRVMNVGKDNGREIRKDRKTILREEKLKKKKPVEVQKTRANSSSNGAEKKEMLLREVMVKIMKIMMKELLWKCYWIVMQQS